MVLCKKYSAFLQGAFGKALLQGLGQKQKKKILQ
jgi:hypothetical protein